MLRASVLTTLIADYFRGLPCPLNENKECHIVIIICQKADLVVNS